MNEELVPADKLIAERLSKLSLKEREEVYEDLHGVRDLIEETSELVTDSLNQMEREIEMIGDKAAYDQAMILSEEFVTKRDTRIQFLRANSFNPKKAAEQIVTYFHCRFELFGIENLVRDIGLDDLDEKTAAALASGVLQVLPNRDSRGRTVVATLATFYNQVEQPNGDEGLLTWGRAFFYVMLSIAEDEETQKKGIIYVSYSLDQVPRSLETRRKLLSVISSIVRRLPIRLSGVHYCHNNAPLMSPILSWMAYATGAAISVRIRTHHGSHSDCQYSMMSYGIPINSFPVTLGGGLTVAEHEKWMQKRRLKEAYLRKAQIPERTVDLPSRSDILLGRGRPFNLHPGNRLLHEIVEAYFDQYNNARREQKTKLAEEIVGIIHRYNGHFLKQNAEAGVWVEVSHLEARNKVNHSFRRKREFDLKASSSTTTINVEADGQGKRRKASE